MRRLLLLITPILFITVLFPYPKKTDVYKYKIGSDVDEKISITCNIEGNKCTVIVKKDGETKEFSFPLDDLDALDSLKEELAESLSDIEIFQFDPSFHKSKMTWLGVNIQSLTDQLRNFFKVKDSGGVLITEVVEDSPAEKAGLKAGDVIVSVDGDKIEEENDLIKSIREKDAGEKVKIKIIRNGRKKMMDVVLEEKELKEPKPYSFFKHRYEKDFSLPYPPKMFKFPKQEFDEELDGLRDEMKELRKEFKKLKEELKELKKSNI